MLPRSSSPTPPRWSRPAPPPAPSTPPSSPSRPGLRPRRHRGRRGVHALRRGERALGQRLQGGQRRCGVGDPLRHVGRCSPGAADHAVASGEHGPSVVVAQMLEGRGTVNHMPLRLQGVLACVFALLIGKLDEIDVKFVRNSYEFRTNSTRMNVWAWCRISGDHA